MLTKEEKIKAFEEWERHCKHVQSMTSVSRITPETPESKRRRIKSLLNNYPKFCEYYFPHFLTLYDKVTGQPIRVVHNAPFHNEAALKVRNTPNLKAAFKWPRGHAKSTHFDIFIPLWLMLQEQPLIKFMVIVGQNEDAAARLLGDLQAELEYNERLIADFGNMKSVGATWQDGEFTSANGIHFLAVGRGQSPRGLRHSADRPDYIVMDDIDDDTMCRNGRRVREAVEWVKEALFGALDVGRGRFIIVGNLISHTSILEEMCNNPEVHVSEIKAVDNEGNPVWKDKWTKDEAQEYARFVGYKAWQKEMMHNPITEGSIFKAAWIQYKKMLPLNKYEELICYTDPSFKGKTSNDYKACRLWGKIGREYHLICCYVRQDSVNGMVRWLYDLWERLPENVAVSFYMEANFIQNQLLDDVAIEGDMRGHQLPIMPDTRKKPDKVARIEAISPLWERGYIYYNEDLKDSLDMKTGIEQTLALERGSSAHDDAPDADEGAIYIMQQHRRQSNVKIRTGKRKKHKNNW